MKKTTKEFIVSSAGWEIEVDGLDEQSAAESALLFLLKKLGKNLMLSTTIMVNKKNARDPIMDANFFLTSLVLEEICEFELSKSLKIITRKNCNDFKYC